ncbi:uncharacterized protein DUF1292 [Natranaerovirga pectinivora]|uniref:Uncharacterized protein DUF1292 n=1 Tax=Natranaerovirga pectinivora TaxID=682400 RepID=A0A4R3MNN6_9FIRM|nr:DUF1292 domain-containing protein [Natranaerovirga pectinivora]TCT16885.1 uncharacterized protein DUF1292 [Natranaerovirga pectinivora]
MEKESKLEFQIDGSDEKVEFYVMEQVRINNTNYLLVTEDEDDDEADLEAYILKEKEVGEDEDIIYEILENEEELTFVSKIFEAKIEDFDFEI